MKQFIRQRLKTNEGILFVIFLTAFILMSILSPGRFLSRGNLQSMAYQLPEFGILALSMMLVIVSGGINLSLTYLATLSMIVGGLVMAVVNDLRQNRRLEFVNRSKRLILEPPKGGCC
jgi:ribose/xylose/arabinose/galactoside ABC-type transport system permease subunit